ncbi:MAG: hypothetical protein HDT28_04850 [Clostridiales bacterium]|nr:hypothetical protein [Clostridiales bacterium]
MAATRNTENRGGYRQNAGRKPKDGTPRTYKFVRLHREAYDAIPADVNKCDYVSNLIIAATKQ